MLSSRAAAAAKILVWFNGFWMVRLRFFGRRRGVNYWFEKKKKKNLLPADEGDA